MRVFITGGSGWIGSATVDELLHEGHSVVGLVRSDDSLKKLEAKGATAMRGDLDDLDSLRRGVSAADAVIHLANKHDFGSESDRAERAAVQAMADALAGTGKPFVVANGLSNLVQGRKALETDVSPEFGPDAPRGGTENLALEYVDSGVRTVIARFAPSVHGFGDWGFVTFLAAAARKSGVSGYIGDGSTEWAAVHRSDAARLLRLGMEHAPAGFRMHAVAEEGITTREIAEELGAALDLPVTSIDPADAGAHFGFMAGFFGLTMSASSAITRAELSWSPRGATLIDDIRAGAYSE
jgi:nucleoside-diphosphate-sugar epimerase